ncbi:MAG: outer membrane peptidoglycan-associated protein [Aureispira sp.]|nr:outer membrane peptidoglycan-associated protein [Aureispira sp.]
MIKSYWILLLMLVSVGSMLAQGSMSWKKRAKEAEALEAKGNFHGAAVFYEQVYAEKSDKPEYIYKAGNCYFLMRDYSNAVKCLGAVKNQNEEYDKPGFKFGVALKQNKQPAKAKVALKAFINSYNGEDKAALKRIVDAEIQGCDFALKEKELTNTAITLKFLDKYINSERTEFSPVALANDMLYFSSTVNGAAEIYSVQRQSGDKWSKREQVKIKNLEKAHAGNPTLTPDGERMYFTQCGLSEDMKPLCQIYVMTKEGNGWSEAIKLPAYINVEGANTTHPFVTVVDDKEILYFSSNREDGKGGADLWYTTRAIGSRGELNFTLPKNLGQNINTAGDEITPFYHKDLGELFFSSNGRANVGGFDIFKSKGGRSIWELAENLGFPINSAADDMYYSISEEHGGGYLVSNRLFYPENTATTDDDIFYFGENRVIVTIKGMITASDAPDVPLAGASVKLFELIDDGEELVEDKTVEDGNYKFVLEPQKQYLVEIAKPDANYLIASYEINTNKFSKSEVVKKNIELKKGEEEIVAAANTPNEEEETVATNGPDEEETTYEEEETTYEEETTEEETVATADVDVDDIISETDWMDEELEEDAKPTTIDPTKGTYEVGEAAPQGVAYRIQVSAVRKFRESKYEKLEETGNLDFEQIEDGLTRVVVIPTEKNEDGSLGFKSKGEALNVLEYIVNNTRFKRAFVIAYENDERVGEGFRGLDEEI